MKRIEKEREDAQYILGVCGYRDTGKTTLVVKLTQELTRMGYRVSTVKHDAHSFDTPGKDSYKHQQAGAESVCVFSRDKSMVIQKGRTFDLERHIGSLTSDFILLEGFKKENYYKIVMTNEEKGAPPNLSKILCQCGETPQGLGDFLHRDDLEGLFQLIQKNLSLLRLEGSET